VGLCSCVRPCCPQSPFPGQLLEGRIPGQGRRKVTSLSKTTVVTNPSATALPACAGECPTCPGLHPTIPSCPKGGIFSSSWPPWPPGTQPPAYHMGAGLGGACGRGLLAMLGVSLAPRLPAQGDGAMAGWEGVSPPGPSLCYTCSKPFPCTQRTRGTGTKGYTATWVRPPQPIQRSFCSPLWGRLPGDDGACWELCLFLSSADSHDT